MIGGPDFIVIFPGMDDLTIGPFATHDAAEAWALATIFHANGQPHEVRPMLPPRPDHAAGRNRQANWPDPGTPAGRKGTGV